MSCSALTASGRRCRNRPVPGEGRCRVHRQPVDEAAVAQLLAMLRAGNYLEIAARAAGVDLDELPPAELIRIGAADAEGEVRAITRIAQAAGTNWQAAAWLLERQHPDRWGRPAAREGAKPSSPLTARDFVDELESKRAARRGEP